MASIQAPSAPSFNLNPTLGPFVIAQDISAVLLSSLTIQIYLYLRRAPKDWRPLTILVILVWALELAGYVAGARFIYNFSITNFGDVEALVFDTPGGLSSTLWPSAVSVALTESFYLIHIRQLAPRRFWVTGLTLLGLLVTWIRCAGWLFLAVRVRNLDSFESPLSIMKIELAAGMLMEILIPLVMGILFWRNRKSATIMFEDLEQDGPLKWLEIVLRWIVQTGALASIVAVVNLALSQRLNRTLIRAIAIFIILSKVFSNCLLASLIGQKKLQRFAQISDKPNGLGSTMQSLSGFLRKIFRSTRPVKDRGSDPEISGNNDVYSVPNPPVATDPWTRRPRPPPPPFPQPSTPTDDYISDVGQVRSAGPLTERAPPPLPPPPPPPFPQPSSPTNDSISDAEQVQSEPELRTHNPDDGNAQARNQPDRYRQATSSSSPTAAIARHDTFASKLSSVDTLPSYRSRPTSLAASLPAYRLSSVVRAQPPLPSLPSLYRFSGLETTVLGASESGRDAGEMS